MGILLSRVSEICQDILSPLHLSISLNDEDEGQQNSAQHALLCQKHVMITKKEYV